MDELEPVDDEEDDVPSPPPGAFGMPAHPLGCGLAAALLFASAIGPVVLMQVAPDRCLDFAEYCPFPPEGTNTGLALAAWAGAAFGLATKWLVGRRLDLWREGRNVRPALWVAFIALFALAWGPGSVLLSLAIALIATVAG